MTRVPDQPKPRCTPCSGYPTQTVLTSNAMSPFAWELVRLSNAQKTKKPSSKMKANWRPSKPKSTFLNGAKMTLWPLPLRYLWPNPDQLNRLRQSSVQVSVPAIRIGWSGFALLLAFCLVSCCWSTFSCVQPWLVLVPGVRSSRKNLQFMMITGNFLKIWRVVLIFKIRTEFFWWTQSVTR